MNTKGLAMLRDVHLRSSLVISTVTLAASGAFGCKKDPPPSIEPDRPAPSASQPKTKASASATIPRPESTSACMPAYLRDAHLEGAWLDGGAAVFCAKTDEFQSPPNQRACFSVDVTTGFYRGLADGLPVPKTKAPPKTAGFARASIGGAFTFALAGGLRTPHGATVTLTDTKTKAVKTAPLEYDEHAFFDGWIGDAVVLHTTVDEGPGCSRALYEPRKTWPLVLYPGGASLGSCYGTEDLVFVTPSKKTAMIDGDGGALVVVDGATLAVDRVDPHRPTMMPGGFVALTPSATEVVLVYDQSIVGDFVRYDLAKEAIVREGSPRLCDEPDAGVDAK